MFPKARQERLTTCVLPDETLVYDHERQKGHCLNATAAMVWRHCDGGTSLDELARHVAAEHGAISVMAAAEVVGLALEQLGRRHLLEQAPALMPLERRIGRRDALRRLAYVVSLPLVMTVATKAAAQSISGVPEDPPPPPPTTPTPPINVNVASGGSRTPASPPPPCRTKGQSCIAVVSGQQGTCCAGLRCTGVLQNAGVCA